jgi:hypothetical protein
MEKIGKTLHAICGAKTRSGIPCQEWGMANGRCRMHGGKSTGPKTPEGIERIRQAHWKHGRCSAQARWEHREIRGLISKAKKLTAAIDEGVLGNSISLDELNSLMEQESYIRSNLFSVVEGAKYITFKDLLKCHKFYMKEIRRAEEFIKLNGFLIFKEKNLS